MALTARDLMETDVETVAPDDEVSEVLGRLARVDFNGFPVVESEASETPREGGEERSSSGSEGHGPSGSRTESDDNRPQAGDGEAAAGRVVGMVTQHDLVHLFQTEDRTLWIPIGLPPFTETLTYAIDVSWDDLDLGIDLARHVDRPISEVMTADVVTVAPDTDLDTILDLLADDERDINRLPVTRDGELVGIVARQDVLRAIRDGRRESKR